MTRKRLRSASERAPAEDNSLGKSVWESQLGSEHDDTR